ncbi:MAG: ERF family protein [Terriglobia bacterium]|nr:ERF family protein [Terriglobia bacterium]
MERSEHIGDLIAALAKSQAEFTFASKDSKNPVFNSSYADLASNIQAVRPVLSKHGIAMLQFDECDTERQTAKVTTSLHLGEQWISVTAEAPATGQKGFNVQSVGSCWTYLRRYTLQAICGLASDDDDGNSLAVENTPTPPAIKSAIPSRDDLKAWGESFRECQTIDEWNAQVVPLMRERSKQFIIAAAEEAKRRGYVGDRSTGLYKNPKEVVNG